MNGREEWLGFAVVVREVGSRVEGTSRSLTRARVLLTGFLLLALVALGGCKALEDHKCPLFDSNSEHKFGSCLFGKNERTVSKGTQKDETDAIARANISPSRKAAWEATEEEIAKAKEKGIDLRSYTWSAQRPNGGALFPKSWQGPGPALVVAPDSIAAPVGSEVIVVASYIGEDSEYLRVGEKVTWDVTGVGQLVETNPNENGGLGLFTGEYQGCLDCKLLKKTKSVNSKTATTTTSSQLWRITRGTESKLDDVTVLKGQSWASATSSEEGTSSVVVMSDTIGNWDKRRAVAQIHWVDAAFKFPESSIGKAGTDQYLTTSVVRLTTGEPREGWTVRYEILGGDAALGPNQAKTLDVPTLANGEARVSLSQRLGQPGTTKIKASVIRPSGERYKSTVVDSKVFFFTWTQVAPITLQLHSLQPSYTQGEAIGYQLTVTNLSDFAQEVEVDLFGSRNSVLVGCDQKLPWHTEYEDNLPGGDGKIRAVKWVVPKLEPRRPLVLSFSAMCLDNTPMQFNAVVSAAKPIGIAGSGDATSQHRGSNVTPSVESSSPDPASVAPSL